MITIPTIETERLVLRPWRAEDQEPHALFCADKDTATYVGGVCNAEDAWRRMATIIGHWKLRGYGMWVIALKGDDRFIGRAGLWSPHGWPEPEIGWGVLSEHQGRGYATEAARASRDYAYRVLGWTTAVSVIAHENHASTRVATRLGAALEHTTENRGWTVGVWRHPGPANVA